MSGGRRIVQLTPLPPNMRLTLPGGDRFKGSGVVVPWRAQDFVHCRLRRRARRPQLKRDPLRGRGNPDES